MATLSQESLLHFSLLEAALKFWVPKEDMRECSCVLSEDIIHTNGRCEFVGGADSWNLKSSDKLAAITLSEMGRARNHCLSCMRSYQPGGFIYECLIKLCLCF